MEMFYFQGLAGKSELNYLDFSQELKLIFTTLRTKMEWGTLNLEIKYFFKSREYSTFYDNCL